MTAQRMTEQEVFQLAEAADLLGDYGYTSEADLVARISENEQILLYTPTASMEQRQPARIYRLRDVEDTAVELAGRNSGNAEYSRALTDLLIALNNK